MKRGVYLLIVSIFILPITFAFCGDGKVDEDGLENCGNCPEDNPCFIDSRCIENTCIPKLIPPLLLKIDPTATIIIPEEIAESINNRFTKETEFVSCLKGKYSDGIYQITKEKQPEIIEDSPFHIEHTGCPKIGTIATIHSHIDGNCVPSSADLFSFGRKKEPIMAIICGENNYGFFSRANPEDKMAYLIREIPEKGNKYLLFFFPWIFSIILLLVLTVFIYQKHKVVAKKNKEIALNMLEEFNRSERKILNILIELGELPRKNIPLSLFTKLNKENLIETRGNVVKMEKWFRDALKGV